MTVLIVEDDRDNADMVAACVQVQWPGADIEFSVRGGPVKRLVADLNPDLIVLDLKLPDISGLDVLNQIRTFSDVPVVVLTARAAASERAKALMDGADD